MIEVATASANHAGAGIVVLVAVGLPGLAVGLSAIGAALSGRRGR